MNTSRLVRLACLASRPIFFGTQKYQSRSASTTNLQTVRRFTDKIENKSKGCWKCEATGAKHRVVCEKCGALVTPDITRNFFDLLGVSETFDINNTKLTENFRQLQSIVHPDKFSNKSDLEQKNAMDWSSLLNKAYSTLSTPLKRAEYMLSVRNMTIPERNESLDPEFLMEMMERNEEIAELETRSQCNEYLAKLKIELENLYKDFSKLLEKNELDDALLGLIRIRYINNLEKKIKEKLYELN